MLFWTPDITNNIDNWLSSTPDQILCCEITPWNGANSNEFERRISNRKEHLCIPLIVNGDEVENFINVIWRSLAFDKQLFDDFVQSNSKFRRDELNQQLMNGIQPDLGIYDCADLLLRVDKIVVLCIRINEFVPDYLTPWVDYIIRHSRVKVIILHTKEVRRIGKLKHFDRKLLPVLSRNCIVEACQYAVYQLTGTYIQSLELDKALSYSQSLNEFISIVQAATVRQCTISTVLISLETKLVQQTGGLFSGVNE